MRNTVFFVNIIKLLIYLNFGIWLYFEFIGHGGWVEYNNFLPLTSPEGVEIVTFMISKNLFISGILVIIMEVISIFLDMTINLRSRRS